MRTPHTHSRCRHIGTVAGLLLVGGAILLVAGGCQQPQQSSKTKTSGDPLGQFDMLGLMAAPIRVGETNLEFAPPPLMLPKRGFFRDALAEQIKQPVQFELMTPRQIRVHLNTGRTSFAIVKPQEVPEIMSTDACEIMAIAINNAGKTYRQGLIITAPNSPFKTIADAKGSRFHFMSLGDLLNDAAMGALIEAGIPRKEMDKSILGLGLDTTHLNSMEVAKSVVLEGKAAGIIDEADYEKWPDKGGSLVLLMPSKDQVRVIGKTMRIPEWPFLVSKRVDPDIKQRVSNLLFKLAPDKYKLALAAMDMKGFAAPIAPKSYDAFAELYWKLHPRPAAAASQPGQP